MWLYKCVGFKHKHIFCLLCTKGYGYKLRRQSLPIQLYSHTGSNQMFHETSFIEIVVSSGLGFSHGAHNLKIRMKVLNEATPKFGYQTKMSNIVSKIERAV